MRAVAPTAGRVGAGPVAGPVVLDGSALIAALAGERGAAAVERLMPGALLSAASLAEVLGLLARRGLRADALDAVAAALDCEVVPFDAEAARLAAALHARAADAEAFGPVGASLGALAALALGLARDLPVLTADPAWLRLDLGARVRLVGDE